MKRRCTHCLFAPYFQADEPKNFAKVQKVFGVSNVTKILNAVPQPQRQDAVNSLVFEAEERLKDPVYGCIGAIASLQDKMFQLQHDLAVARATLARCSSKTSYASCSTTSPLLMLGGDLGLASFDDFVVDLGRLTDKKIKSTPFSMNIGQTRVFDRPLPIVNLGTY